MVNPPKPGDISYPLYEEELNAELASLRRRAQMVSEAFDALPGMSCNPTEGAMYSFPKVWRDAGWAGMEWGSKLDLGGGG